MPAIITEFGGKALGREGRFQILEGADTFHRFAVIKFPSLEAAQACHGSPEPPEPKPRAGLNVI